MFGNYRIMGRGGKRPGAGRKSEDRVPVCMKVGKVTKERMAVLRDNGVMIGKEVDRMIAELYDKFVGLNEKGV